MKQIAALFLAATIHVVSAQSPTTAGAYQLSPEFPKYVTAHVELRDPSGQRWPSLFYGKPETAGIITVNESKPAAMFTLKCDNRPQKNGDQSRRVLGEIFNSTNIIDGVTLKISGMGPLRPRDGSKKPELETTFTGVLDVAGRSVVVTAAGVLTIHRGGRGDEKNDALMGELQFDTKASELKLQTFAPNAPIHIRAAFTAYPPGAGARRTPATR